MLKITAKNSSYINFLQYFLAIPHSFFENAIKNIIYAAYVIFLNLVIAYGVYFELHGRTRYDHGINANTSALIGFLETILLGLANVSISISLLMNAKDGCVTISEKIEEFDKEICKNSQRNPSENTTMKILMILLIHILCFSMLFIEIYVGDAFDTADLMHYHIWDNILRYRLNIFVANIYFFIKELHQRIKFINRTLKNAATYLIDDHIGKRQHSIASTTLHLCQIPEMTKKASKAYGIILEIVEVFNRIFGWLLLVLIVNYLLLCLLAFSTALRMKTYREISWVSSVWLSMLILTAVTGAVSISSICNRTTKEAKKTASLAYSLLLNLNQKKDYDEEKLLTENMILLIRKTSSYSPIFTAAGFFIIDYSGLFTLMNLLTSYVIVLIQFV